MSDEATAQPQTPAVPPNAVDATDRKAPSNAMERLAAAKKAVLETAGDQKEADPAKPEPKADPTAADAKPPTAEKPKTEPKTEEKPADKTSERLREGARALAEKEAKFLADRKAFEDQKKAYDAQLAPLRADLETLRKVNEAVKGGSRLAALKILGVELEDVQNEWLAQQRGEPSPVDVKAAAREEFDRLQREAKEKADKDASAAQEAQNKQFQEGVAWWQGEVEKHVRGEAAKYPALAKVRVWDPALGEHRNVTAADVWARAQAEAKKTGKLPTSAEAAALLEQDLSVHLPAEKPPAKAKTEDKKPEATAKAPTKTLTQRDAGSVPIRPMPARRETAFDRLKKAKASVLGN